MEALKFGAVLVVVVFVQVFGALGTSLSSEDDEMWTADNWQGFPLEKDFTMHLADIIKRSKSHQFHGLMGRSSGLSLSDWAGKETKERCLLDLWAKGI
ncbi:tachykinin-4 isoform X2 [Cheilinus undulatus]|uniref:tachykinin-4 isoform X2 n=1 Tax=Cheilinus undulatus TaxID=241271 RepID=UPI001BD44165|nr:tachykinin-4 isoform X2 [Cheilinus undulatus]